LVLTVAAGSNVAIPETVHLVMRAVARASLCNRNRSMPTPPRNSDKGEIAVCVIRNLPLWHF